MASGQGAPVLAGRRSDRGCRGSGSAGPRAAPGAPQAPRGYTLCSGFRHHAASHIRHHFRFRAYPQPGHGAPPPGSDRRGGPGLPPSIWAVIKANAYGHGIEQAVAGFSSAQGLAMLDLDEAVRCREAGWGGPILLLEGFFEPADLDIVDRYHLSTSVHHREQLDMLARARLSRKVDIMLKLNSGMNRLGFSPAAYPAAFERAQLLQQQGVLGSVGKMTHFACADGPQGVNEQLGLFNPVTHRFPGAVSVCNSAATLRFAEIAVGSETQAHWVRPGVCLYGASPFADADAASFLACGLPSRCVPRSSRCRNSRPAIRSATAPFSAPSAPCASASWPAVTPTAIPGTPTGTPVMVAGAHPAGWAGVHGHADGRSGPGARRRRGLAGLALGRGRPVGGRGGPAAGTIGYELLCAVAPRVPVIREP